MMKTCLTGGSAADAGAAAQRAAASTAISWVPQRLTARRLPALQLDGALNRRALAGCALERSLQHELHALLALQQRLALAVEADLDLHRAGLRDSDLLAADHDHLGRSTRRAVEQLQRAGGGLIGGEAHAESAGEQAVERLALGDAEAGDRCGDSGPTAA